MFHGFLLSLSCGRSFLKKSGVRIVVATYGNFGAGETRGTSGLIKKTFRTEQPRGFGLFCARDFPPPRSASSDVLLWVEPPPPLSLSLGLSRSRLHFPNPEKKTLDLPRSKNKKHETQSGARKEEEEDRD